MTIAIRDLTTFDEFQQVRQIQQRCWGFTHGEGLYAPLLISAARSGGMVLGAFDGAQMIGFLFGFLGVNPNRRLKLCSQTMGVLPDYRNRGVAAQLKWAQRVRMLAVGIDLITWTFDPLEAPNARLNLHTLGATVSTYDRNLFGEDFGELGRGLPSDRFQASWWISSPRVNRLAAGEAMPFAQEDVVVRGHAIEIRVNAEDPWNDYLPSPGRLTRFRLPQGPDVRVDTYGYVGCAIPERFDPLLANLLPNADLVMTARTGHWMQWERAGLFNRIVTEFLAS